MKMELHPQKGIAVEFSGFKPEEIGTAIDSMARSEAFTKVVTAVMPDQKKKALKYKREYDDDY